jgi:prepilin-type N-terminal cleavage/methylation domain-containing protein
MFKKGFTLVEVLLVIGIAAVIFVMATPFALNFYRGQLINEAQSSYINTLQGAHNNAVLQKNDSAWGVRFYSDEHCFVMFQGAAPASCDPEGLGTFDERYDLIPEITVTGFGVDENIVFTKRTGTASGAGTTTLVYQSLARNILVEHSGVISIISE